jgi:hypothetical protein
MKNPLTERILISPGRKKIAISRKKTVIYGINCYLFIIKQLFMPLDILPLDAVDRKRAECACKAMNAQRWTNSQNWSEPMSGHCQGFGRFHSIAITGLRMQLIGHELRLYF